MVTGTVAGGYPNSSDFAFNIDDFRAAITNLGIARNNAYEVVLYPPAAVIATMGDEKSINKYITMYAESVTLPGISLATTEIRNNTIGPVDHKPYLPLFPKDLMMNFMVDENALIVDFFHMWIRNAVNFTSEGRNFDANEFNKASSYEVSYRRDKDGVPQYTTDLYIGVLNNNIDNRSSGKSTGRQILQYTLYNAYPVLVGDIQVAYGNENSILTLPVAFNFTDWSTRRFVSTTPNSTAGPSTTIGGLWNQNINNSSDNTGTKTGSTSGSYPSNAPITTI